MNERKQGRAMVGALAVLHLLCCGIPLLIVSGVSLGFLFPRWPVIAVVLAALGAIGFAWFLKRGCAACPRSDGRCIGTAKEGQS